MASAITQTIGNVASQVITPARAQASGNVSVARGSERSELQASTTAASTQLSSSTTSTDRNRAVATPRKVNDVYSPQELKRRAAKKSKPQQENSDATEQNLDLTA